MPETTALCVVAGGATYHRYALALMASAREFFHPTEHVTTHIIEGEYGWPNGTMMRYHRLLEAMPDADYVFLCDADMLMVAPVGAEILPSYEGLAATLHPGYVRKPRAELPYETNPESAAWVAPDEGDAYYCGGFVGGTWRAMRGLANTIAGIIDLDVQRGITPRWHDESALNRCLAVEAPAVVLSPSYCHPDNDAYYRGHVWDGDFVRRIVALDKPSEERQGR